jgi:glutamate synthase (NADPH/NADH)
MLDDTWTCTDSSDFPPSLEDQQAASVGMETILENHDPTDPSFPARQGLYNPEEERDACGVGFIVHIKGKGNHKIVSDARGLLCNMTHRGASECWSTRGRGSFEAICTGSLGG